MTVNLKSASALTTARLAQSNPGPLVVPQVTSAINSSTTGGTLGNSTTYWLRATASNGAGEGLPSPEFSYYLGNTGTSTNQIVWSILIYPGTTTVKVYRGTASLGEQLIGSITGITWSAAQLAAGSQTVTLTDTGSSPSGAYPTSDASGTATETAIYTVPSSTTVRLDEIVISNTGSLAATCGVGIVPSGGSLDGTHFVVPANFSIQAGDTRVVTLHQGLDTGDKITILVPNSLITVTASGLVQAA